MECSSVRDPGITDFGGIATGSGDIAIGTIADSADADLRDADSSVGAVLTEGVDFAGDFAGVKGEASAVAVSTVEEASMVAVGFTVEEASTVVAGSTAVEGSMVVEGSTVVDIVDR